MKEKSVYVGSLKKTSVCGQKIVFKRKNSLYTASTLLCAQKGAYKPAKTEKHKLSPRNSQENLD